jgi:hypothetical protein
MYLLNFEFEAPVGLNFVKYFLKILYKQQCHYASQPSQFELCTFFESISDQQQR